MRLIAHLLSQQDPGRPHTLLTRLLISGIIIFAELVYAGFFGVIGIVVVYLVGVELMGLGRGWLYAPVVIALLIGGRRAVAGLVEYWRNHGHG